MRAVILAAGFGTRLWPLTEDRTKPAIPFLKRPLICYSAEYLATHGIRDLIVNLHHHPESIRRALGDGSEFGISIKYSFEEEILGTSGALDRVREMLVDEDFVVINGKIVTDIDLGRAIGDHRDRKAIATLILRRNVAREHFSNVEVDASGAISRFAGFPQPLPPDDGQRHAEGAGAPLMFTGIQILSPRIFEYIPRNRFSHSTTEVYPRAIEAGELVLGHVSTGNWNEMSTLGRYRDASLALMEPNENMVISGAGSVIEPGASVRNSILWERVKVENGASVNRSVLGDGVRIPPGARIENAVVVRLGAISQMERGEVVGDNLIVGIW
jgi:NDP-sugar pyrophosphorylase family protein